MDELGYVGLFLIMVAENVVPPVPSEPFLLAAGFAAANGSMSTAAAVVASTTGSVVGAAAWYFTAFSVPPAKLRAFVERRGRYLMVRTADLDRVLGWFDRHADAAVLAGRLIPIGRMLASVAAGTVRMPTSRFLVLSAAGSTAWCTALIVTGRLLAGNDQAVLAWLDAYQRVVLGGAAAGVLVLVSSRLARQGPT